MEAKGAFAPSVFFSLPFFDYFTSVKNVGLNFLDLISFLKSFKFKRAKFMLFIYSEIFRFNVSKNTA